MGRLRSALCAAALALLVPLAIRAWQVLPLDQQALVEKKYAGWSGVLRLWVCEGWQSGAGSLSAWLNRCAARFEKTHPGVYIQPQYVDADTLAAFRGDGLPPPDLLLFSPGLLDSPEGLRPLEAPGALRPSLRDRGLWAGRCYAVPVAMGGYLWAWNAALLEAVPGDWRSAGTRPAVPAPEDGRRWDAALLALCAGQPAGANGATPAPPGLDLGLTDARTPGPTPADGPRSGQAWPLTEDDPWDGDAWRRFINGEAAAMPVTQWEIRRLQALSDQGRGPDWRLSAGGAAFTDQLLCLALVDKPDAQAELGEAFLALLLEEASQRELHRAGAFAVTDADSGYGGGDPLARMDAALRAGDLAAPGVFGRGWAEACEGIVRKWRSGAADSAAAWDELAGCLR